MRFLYFLFFLDLNTKYISDSTCSSRIQSIFNISKTIYEKSIKNNRYLCDKNEFSFCEDINIISKKTNNENNIPCFSITNTLNNYYLNNEDNKPPQKSPFIDNNYKYDENMMKI